MMDIRHCDGLELLDSLADDSIDLILTDPPYIISHDSHRNDLNKAIARGDDMSKTEDEWIEWRRLNPHVEVPNMKEKFLRFGSPYGRKFAQSTSYGSWDEGFTLGALDEFIGRFYKKLRTGGTVIVWFDIWKISVLKEMLEKHGFKQIRFIEWVKTNPQPLNASQNYLPNAREIALTAVKKGKPTFHGRYDDGIYRQPVQVGKIRKHPTQKSLAMFEDIVRKHSNEGDLVVDPFLGGGTTAFAAKNTGRRFIGSELCLDYVRHAQEILK